MLSSDHLKIPLHKNAIEIIACYLRVTSSNNEMQTSAGNFLKGGVLPIVNLIEERACRLVV